MRNINVATKKRQNVDQGAKGVAVYLTLLGCGVFLLSGFFFAGHQHFASMDFGMKNSRLRKQIEDLKAEKQRLLFTRELSMSPTEIKKAAKKVGIFEKDRPVTIAPEMASAIETRKRPLSATVSKPALIKTGLVRSLAPKAEMAVQKIVSTTKTAKTTSSE